MPLRVVAFGGGDYRDRDAIYEALDRVHAERGISVLIVAHSTSGADGIAEEWAVSRGIPADAFLTAWDDVEAPGALVRTRRGTGRPYNALAAFWRNRDMLEIGKPDVGVAFPGESARDMLDRCKKAGIPVWKPYE